MGKKDDDELESAAAAIASSVAELKKAFGPGDVEAHFELAIAYEEMGLHAEALSELEIVERAGPLDNEQQERVNAAQARGYLLRARAREAAGDLAGALTDYQRVRAAVPGHKEANAGYARLAALVLLA